MNKVKEVFNVLKTSALIAKEGIAEVFKRRIKTADEVINLLRTSASVEDLYAIQDALLTVKGTLPSKEYVSYDSAFGKIIQFKHNKNKLDILSDEETLKVFKVVNAIKAKKSDIYCITNRNSEHQYFIMVHEGKNGNGDFVDDDMKNVVKYLDKLSANGATWRTVTDMVNDILDDVSVWVLTFKV